MIENYFDKAFELRYFEMNSLGNASPTIILTLLEETAADHCYAIKHSLFQLKNLNIGWVLVSGYMQMDRYPSYKEKITIRTWLSQYSKIRGYRENIIYDEQNTIIGRSRGLWVFFNIAKRRPIQIFDAIKENWSFCSFKSIDYSISEKVSPINESDYELKFIVNRYDTNMNNHVNNIRYLQWVIESVPEEIVNNYFLYSITGRFIAEAHYKQTVTSLINNNYNNKQEISFNHTIKIEGSDTICATAKSTWKRKYERDYYHSK
ncbi:acyl-[acyl-carrier-protein] thioesterase [Maribacter sp. IgM3_T14_3]|uniref:acyl-[acyl-carrier-protein] thioesterase n=1 Tax=Maribacter sp. IgM3_T14_3 TaxID=3415140 RepID=UPI003C6FB017